MMEKFRIGYFADSPWGHLTLDKLLQDVSLEIAFIVPRNDTKDSYLKSKANDYGIDYLENVFIIFLNIRLLIVMQVSCHFIVVGISLIGH